jgi:hypothetical protein
MVPMLTMTSYVDACSSARGRLPHAVSSP